MLKTLLLLTASALLAVSGAAQDLAVRAARVHTGSGAPLENATVLVHGGKITAVGADVEVPADVFLIEHPADLAAGMIALRDRAGTGAEGSDSTRAFLPGIELRFAHAAGHRELQALLREGVTALQIGADPSALVGGLTAVVKAHGESVVHARSSLAVSLSGEALLPNRYPTSYAAAVDELRALIEGGAGSFAAVKAKNLPLWVHVQERHEAQRALDLLAEHELGGVIEGVERIGELAQRLAQQKIGVVLPAYSLGGTFHAAHSSVALAEAGVRFGYALDSPGNDPAALRLAAAAAMRAGLDGSRAWTALTSDAARLCRSEQRIGSIAPGLDADLVLWSGSPLDLGSRVLMVFIDGERAWELPAAQRKKVLERLEDEVDELPPGVTPEEEANDNGGEAR